MLERCHAGDSSDVKLPVLAACVGELVDPVHVDEPFRAREPEVEKRDQALAACEYLRLVAVAGQEIERLLDGARLLVGEGSRLHRRRNASPRTNPARPTATNGP
jgi:hypothetical protein